MGSMQNGVWSKFPLYRGPMGKMWRNNKGGIVTDTKAYTPGGITAAMSQDEVDAVKKRRSRGTQTAIESETLGGGR